MGEKGNSPTSSLKVILKRDVHNALKIQAILEGINLNDLCVRALEAEAKKGAKR